MTPKEWRCFHCDELFTEEAEAREHFGTDESKTPACRLPAGDVRHIRDLEAGVDLWQRRALKAEEEAEGLGQCHAEVMRLTNGHGVFMELDYREGEKLVLQERVRHLEAELADHLLHALAEPQLQENKEDLSRVEPAGRSERPRTAEGQSGNAASAERTER
jgi:hypothetical protein